MGYQQNLRQSEFVPPLHCMLHNQHNLMHIYYHIYHQTIIPTADIIQINIKLKDTEYISRVYVLSGLDFNRQAHGVPLLLLRIFLD